MKTKRFRKSLPAAAVLVALASAPVQSAVVWHFNYTDAAGVGFNDAVEGAARQQALEDAANYLSTFLTAYNADLFLDVDGSVADGSTLAAAGPEFNIANTWGGTQSFGFVGDIQSKILTGNDPGGAAKDGSVTWNFTDFTWELGSDFQPNEFDFQSTARHELLHALGFLSGVDKDGNDVLGNAPNNQGAWMPWDEFVADANGRLIDSSTYQIDLNRWATASIDGFDGQSFDPNTQSACGRGLLFDGPNAKAANGGSAVEIYSPNPWEDGSSGSHIDDQCYKGTYMMEAATNPGLSTRAISGVEIGMMRDLGYTQFGQQSGGGGGGGSAAVPSAPIGSLLMAGLGLLGFGRRRLGRA